MKILVVDGETAERNILADRLSEQGHVPMLVADGRDALARIESEGFDLVFADLRLSSLRGLDLLRSVKSGPRSQTELVLMSANGSVRTAVEAVKSGAFAFVTKPLTAAEIAALIARWERKQEQKVSRQPPGPKQVLPVEDPDSPAEIDRCVVGSCDAMQRVKQMIRVSARTDANVLICGETGVGKDLIASIIHHSSHRRKLPFVKVGCALLPASLIESELYGHEEGSFTGAAQPRKGRFELAEGGTVYLDDVDDIPLVQQAKLLRAIEEKIFERVGGTRALRANVRVVSSSKKNLLTKIGEGGFRADLYYRLDVLRIRVPPLRERRQDIPALTEHLLARIAGDTPHQIDAEAMVALTRQEWPGNVRELYHTLERAFLVGGGHISAELIHADLASSLSPASSSVLDQDRSSGSYQSVMRDAEKQLLLSALEACNGNKTKAAHSLGMKPSTFRDRLAKHGIP